MNVSIPQLKAFAAVARHRNFTRAAAELGLTQSAVSRSVHELEEAIDQRLFYRTTRLVALTDAGQYVAERMCHLIEEVEQTLRESQSASKPSQGQVQIASDPVLSSMSVPAWVAGCKKVWPDISIKLKDCVQEPTLQSVRRGEVDFGIALDPEPSDDLYCESLCLDAYLAVLPADHAFALRDSVGWSDLRDVNVLTLDQQFGVQRAVEQTLFNHDVQAVSVQTFGHFAGIFGMVSFGLGIGVVPSRALATGLNPAVVSRPLLPQVTCGVMLVRRKRRLLSPNAAAIWNAMRSQELRGESGATGVNACLASSV